jgi:hypothetical protein
VWAEVPTKKQILSKLSSVLSNLKYVSDISDSEYDPETDALVKYELLMIKGRYQGLPIRILCDEALPGFSCTVWVAGYFNRIRKECHSFPKDIVQAIEEVVSLYRRIYGNKPVTNEPDDWREYWEDEEEEEYESGWDWYCANEGYFKESLCWCEDDPEDCIWEPDDEDDEDP